ncbi:rhomboid family intramembrane serine protease [Sporichthya brevicatena]|uniref:Rhomboid family intramembrane serine protease n=1 Tax=Sporichthya brevicatena TaxID=171442 RepID=A0ABN1GV52_9ACTN
MTDGTGSGETPVCYRHPGRETYVRCGRCERYICPDDMISAAVGFQCPECVADGHKGVREPRTVVGAPVRGTGNGAVVTMAIIVVNVLIFFAVQGSDQLLNQLSLRPFSGDDDGVAQGGWHRLLTAAFVHEAPLHIAFNMLALWLFGRPLEMLLGPVRYLLTYLLCALGGSTFSYLFLGIFDGSIGASGAVFGLIGALLVVDRQVRANPSSTVIFLAFMLLPGFVIDNIDWRGHVGGLVTGALLGALFVYAPARNRVWWQATGCLVLVGVCLVAVQLRTERLEDQIREGLFFNLGAPASTSAVVHTGDNGCGELHRCNSGVPGV